MRIPDFYLRTSFFNFLRRDTYSILFIHTREYTVLKIRLQTLLHLLIFYGRYLSQFMFNPRNPTETLIGISE